MPSNRNRGWLATPPRSRDGREFFSGAAGFHRRLPAGMRLQPTDMQPTRSAPTHYSVPSVKWNRETLRDHSLSTFEQHAQQNCANNQNHLPAV